MGRIEVITGSMFSGKSEELIRRVRRALIAKKNVKVFKPKVDQRYSAVEVVSHNGTTITSIALEKFSDVWDYIDETTEVVGVDEAQFFNDSIASTCQRLADEGICVIVAGLDMDYRRNPFGPMPELFAIADDVLKLKAVCINCGEPAYISHRLSQEQEQVVVGAKSKYEALCRKCFLKEQERQYNINKRR